MVLMECVSVHPLALFLIIEEEKDTEKTLKEVQISMLLISEQNNHYFLILANL